MLSYIKQLELQTLKQLTTEELYRRLNFVYVEDTQRDFIMRDLINRTLDQREHFGVIV